MDDANARRVAVLIAHVTFLVYKIREDLPVCIFSDLKEKTLPEKKSVPLQILPLKMAISTLKSETKPVRTSNKN